MDKGLYYYIKESLFENQEEVKETKQINSKSKKAKE